MAFGYPLYVNGRELKQPLVVVHAAPGTYQSTARPAVEGLGKIRLRAKGKFKLKLPKIKIKKPGKVAAAILTGGASLVPKKARGKVAAALLTGGASLVPKKKRATAAAAVLTGGASLLATKKIRSTVKKKPGEAALAVLTGGASLAVPKKSRGKVAAALLTGGASLLVPKKVTAKIGATFKGKAKIGGKGKTTSTTSTPSTSTTSTAPLWMNKIKSTGKTKGLSPADIAKLKSTIKSTGKTSTPAVIAPVVDEAVTLPEEPVVGFGTKLGIGLLGLLLVGGGAYLLLRKKSPSPSSLGARSSTSPRRSSRGPGRTLRSSRFRTR